jgi:uncharacterized protein YbaR (Trm112 family)
MTRGVFRRLLTVAACLSLAGACDKKQPADSAHPTSSTAGSSSDARQRLSPDLLKILADPGDKGALIYTIDSDDNEWLVNPRNGYRYPVRDGVPVMLLEEGARNRDPKAIHSTP